MVNVFYYRNRNFGDRLNKQIFEKELNMKIVASSYKRASIMGIGSIIYNMLYLKNERRKSNNIPIHIFSSGFNDSEQIKKDVDSEDEVRILRSVNLYAVRGKKTKSMLESYHLYQPDDKIILGDAGLS